VGTWLASEWRCSASASRREEEREGGRCKQALNQQLLASYCCAQPGYPVMPFVAAAGLQSLSGSITVGNKGVHRLQWWVLLHIWAVKRPATFHSGCCKQAVLRTRAGMWWLQRRNIQQSQRSTSLGRSTQAALSTAQQRHETWEGAKTRHFRNKMAVSESPPRVGLPPVELPSEADTHV
jgi:hypothetical protein